jgi:PhnB protein
MAKAASPVPAGFHTMTPQLVLDDAAAAIDWYKRAFGARRSVAASDPTARSCTPS